MPYEALDDRSLTSGQSSTESRPPPHSETGTNAQVIPDNSSWWCTQTCAERQYPIVSARALVFIANQAERIRTKVAEAFKLYREVRVPKRIPTIT